MGFTMTQRVVIVTLITILASLGLNCAIAAKPRVSVVAVKAQAAEKGSINGQFQLVADAPVSKALTVSYAVGGSAKGGKDYKKIKAKTTIRAGQSVAYVDVIPVADKKSEKPETVKLILKNGRNYLRGNARSASIQITDDPVPGTGSTSGTLYYASGTRAKTLDLATGAEKEVVRLSLDSSFQLGYGGGIFTDVETTGVSPEYVTVNLRQSTGPNLYTLLGSLGPFPLPGLQSGPVHPSPDGKLFSMRTRESAGLGEPYFNYVYVFDAALDIVFKLRDYYHPAWLGNDRLVVASGSNLYTVTVSASPVVTRIGPDGLGLPAEGTGLPMASPDGRSIAFTQGEAVWRINVDGSGLAQLTKPRLEVGWPSWSPDGSQLVVSRAPCQFFDNGSGLYPQGSTNRIYIISATATLQDLDTIRSVTSACGPVYWLP